MSYPCEEGHTLRLFSAHPLARSPHRSGRLSVRTRAANFVTSVRAFECAFDSLMSAAVHLGGNRDAGC